MDEIYAQLFKSVITKNYSWMRRTIYLILALTLLLADVSAQSLELKGITIPQIAVVASLFALISVILIKRKKSAEGFRRTGSRFERPEIGISGTKKQDGEYSCDVCGTDLETNEDKVLHEEAFH